MTSLTRRSFLKLLATLGAPDNHPFSEARSSDHHPFEDVMRLPRSKHFGLTSQGAPLSPGSFYRTSTADASELSFDISNNQVAASLTRHGDIRRACLCTGVSALPPEKIKGGVYCSKQLLYGAPCSLHTTIDSVDLPDEAMEVALLENVLPVFSSVVAGVQIHRLLFAPVRADDTARSPRAVLITTMWENNTKIARTLRFSAKTAADHSSEAAALSDSDSALSSTHENTRAILDAARTRWFHFPQTGTGTLNETDHFAVSVAPHTSGAFTMALVLSESLHEEKQTVVTLGAKPARRWLQDTLQARRQSYGKLSIPDDTFAAESLVRYAELSRQSALRTGEGLFAGGFLGSDVDTVSSNWTRDAYYSMLAMSVVEPRLCADSISYFLQWGQPAEVSVLGKTRFPNVTSVSQSLSNSVSGLSLAAAYYRATGNRDFFTHRPEILSRAQTILGEVLVSRREKPMLFPSIYFSDGEARGDFHTGSNLAVWFAFHGMARIAAEVYRDDRLAADWSSVAKEIAAAIGSHCVGEGRDGQRFFEGANSDGTLVQGHDGEESETTLMPFYGFCQPDDSRLLSHAALAMTAQNPLYSKELDAIWWYNSAWRSATFPGWTTALAGASDESQLRSRLDRIRSLTDLDGSLWWWPYPYGSKDRSNPVRGDLARKCGWGAAVYLCRFIHDVLGISVDAASRSIRFAPFTPWTSFTWKDARFGATKFDLSHHSSGEDLSVILTNRNRYAYTATIVLTPRPGSTLTTLRASGVAGETVTKVDAWKRQALETTVTCAPGQRVKITANPR